MQIVRVAEVKGGTVLLTHEDGDIKASMAVEGLYFSHIYKNAPVASMTDSLASDFYEAAFKYLKGEKI